MGPERVLSPGPVPVSQGTRLARARCHSGTRFVRPFSMARRNYESLGRGRRGPGRGCFDGRGSR